MPPKRTASDAEFDDLDEEPTLGRQVLPVANLPADFAGEPLDGLQYLFTVRRDARALPRFTRVANPYAVKEEQVDTPAATSNVGTPHPALPTEEWREVFLTRFRNFRKNSMQPTIHVDLPTSSKSMPEKRQREEWWAFIEGKPRQVWDPPKKPKQNKWQKGRYSEDAQDAPGHLPYEDQEANLVYDEILHVASASGSLPTPSTTPAPDASSVTNTEAPVKLLTGTRREPTPSLMQYIDHRYAVHLLMYFTHWITIHLERSSRPASYFAHTHARWIFILLSRVEDDVSADETSLLRSLARACMGLIKDINHRGRRDIPEISSTTAEIDSSMDERSCWLIITAVVGIWGQRDLWMDAEELLTDMKS